MAFQRLDYITLNSESPVAIACPTMAFPRKKERPRLLRRAPSLRKLFR
jgi:hypothetical protein